MTRVERWLCYAAILLPFLFLSWIPVLERGFFPSPVFEISEVKLCLNIDQNRKPEEATSVFPAGTKKIYCWFSWKQGRPGAKIISRWYYSDQNIHILDVPVALTRNSGEGVVSLVMPEGKVLPSGSYGVEFELRGKVIRTTRFVVLPNQGKPLSNN